jgi:hypothetical protein
MNIGYGGSYAEYAAFSPNPTPASDAFSIAVISHKKNREQDARRIVGDISSGTNAP